MASYLYGIDSRCDSSAKCCSLAEVSLEIFFHNIHLYPFMQSDNNTNAQAGPSLNRRGVMGGIWVAALQGVTQLLSLIRVFVLARLLAPDDFGLFAIAMLAMSLIEALSQTGVQQALIQKKGEIESYLDTAWTIQILRGVLLAACLVAAAPWITDFFEQPHVASLIRPLALAVLLNGFINISVIHFQRKLEFHKEFLYRVAPVLIDICVALTAAVLLRDAMALVYGLLAKSVALIVLSYVICPQRAKIGLKLDQVRELYQFGKWMFVFGILVYVINQMDRAIVGKLLGATELGYYYMAFLIGTLLATHINAMISRLLFPLYSKLRHEESGVRQAYIAVLDACSIIIFPVTCAIVIFANDIVTILLSAKWLPMIPVLQILALKGLLWTLAAATGGPMYFAFGRPDINVKINLIQLLILALLIYPLAERYGIIGVAVLVVVSMAISYLLNIGISMKFTRISLKQYFSTIKGPIVGSFIASMLALGCQLFLTGTNVIGFLASLFVMIATYAIWLGLSGRYRLAIKLWSIVRAGRDV